METNNSFSIQRLVLLCKQSMIIYKKPIGITLAGFSAIIFIALIVMQSAANFSNWDNSDSTATFIFLFFQFGFIYTCLSFPAFRSKEKSMVYLMLPASVSEKYTFELLTRIVLYIVLMPLLYWLVANIEGIVVHSFIPELTNYKFSFGKVDSGFMSVVKNGKFEFWAMIMVIQGILFVFIAPFTGASHFSKSPLLKTAFTFLSIIAAYGFFVFLLVKGLGLDHIHSMNNKVLFLTEDNVLMFLGILSTLINLSLLSIAFFKLKEKEA